MPSLSTHCRTFFEKGAVAVGAASLGGSLLEVGGTSLHPTLAQKVTNLELLRILAEHRPQRNQAFRDLAGQSRQRLCPSPLPALVSPGSTGATVSFADLTKAQGETNLESLNMPEPCHFLDPTLGPLAIIRKTSAKGRL